MNHNVDVSSYSFAKIKGQPGEVEWIKPVKAYFHYSMTRQSLLAAASLTKRRRRSGDTCLDLLLVEGVASTPSGTWLIVLIGMYAEPLQFVLMLKGAYNMVRLL